MRKSPVKLVLASSLPLALSACGPSEPTYTVTQRVNYDDLAACVADQVPQKDCEQAYKQAYTEYLHGEPLFFSLSECEAEFSAGGCTLKGGYYKPHMSGFELETSGEVTQSQLAKVNNDQSNLGGSMATGVLAGMLLSQVLPGDRHYRAQPLYNYSAGGKSYRRGLFSQRYAIQRDLQQEQQGSSGGGGSYGGGGSSSSSSSSNTTSSGSRWGSSSRAQSRSTVSSSISRGGFGSQATARSGWGGRSGSFFGG
ncbi:DUF1190 domain-containing protein [Pseudomonas xanthosomatis]|uniref:DUF1190 domain-containing protein n=1 Tax=Pseudomonas xanthosomatis TaxID=2842356 RepID=UPI001C3D0B98|nr:DUF1190 domain-containing protein [Pseudomonas xanthosomatis]QXH48595.1 DUF1190 domain-containing protein [Pseudomonas xanthosomatis]